MLRKSRPITDSVTEIDRDGAKSGAYIDAAASTQAKCDCDSGYLVASKFESEQAYGRLCGSLSIGGQDVGTIFDQRGPRSLICLRCDDLPATAAVALDRAPEGRVSLRAPDGATIGVAAIALSLSGLQVVASIEHGMTAPLAIPFSGGGLFFPVFMWSFLPIDLTQLKLLAGTFEPPLTGTSI
jgi:hypothetical protein